MAPLQSTAADVSRYIEEAPEERRALLTSLRSVCHDALEGYDEGMEYGMPSYSRNGVVEVAFASQKNYMSLYVRTAVLDAHRERLPNASLGKGCVRFRRPEDVDWAVVGSLLEATRHSSGPVC